MKKQRKTLLKNEKIIKSSEFENIAYLIKFQKLIYMRF